MKRTPLARKSQLRADPAKTRDWQQRSRKPLKATPLKPVNKERRAGKRAKYKAHLRSAYWQTVRALIWQRCGTKVTDQFEDGETKASLWHFCERCSKLMKSMREMHGAHRTYARFGAEHLTDVDAACRECNMAERASQNWYKGNQL